MKFDMSHAWRDAVAMIKTNREVLLIVAGIFFFFPALATSLLVPGMQDALVNQPDVGQAVLQVYGDYWWLILLVAIAQTIGMLTLLALLRDKSQPTVGEAIRTGLTGVLPYLLATLLIAFGVFAVLMVLVGIPAASGSGVLAALGTLAFIALAIYCFVKLSLIPPVIAVDKLLNPVAALQRSWNLTKGAGLRLLVFYLLIGIAYMVVMLVLGMVLGALVLVLGESLGQVIEAVVSSLLDAAVTVIFVAVLAGVHRQLTGTSPENARGAES
ncbi:hypothetical protein [Altericroceibacterium xinjiangense]|uniref:hypothetical protein n=1 Tax=Altericroceibacterium xinjiangense TaxID=762261 RepID=UPI000F7EE4F8|nr:hypothetical protein [Altericroceibacterium xinjiangense]